MNKALVYVVIAIFLGLATALIPTWIFIVRGDSYGKVVPRSANYERGGLPLLEYSEQNGGPAISSREVEVLGISFFIAVAVFLLVKRKAPRHDYLFWPPSRKY